MNANGWFHFISHSMRISHLFMRSQRSGLGRGGGGTGRWEHKMRLLGLESQCWGAK